MAEPFARQDAMTGEWVIFAPNRAKRPSDMAGGGPRTAKLDRHDPDCPFCPGNEDRLERIKDALPPASADPDGGPGWLVRAVPNKYPALTPGNDAGPRDQGLYACLPGEGEHEVIIEHPRHDVQIPDLAPSEMERLVEMYSRRYDALTRGREHMLCVIFRNHGERAGTSLLHPHSQVILSGVTPRARRDREQVAQEYHDDHGRCLTCDYIAREREDVERVVLSSEHFTAAVPFAASVPCEIAILPHRHMAEFGQLRDPERADLAELLQTMITLLRDSMNDPDYNFAIDTSPRGRAGAPQLHWRLRIMPRLTERAGFEVGSGICINPNAPERDAATLRDALAAHTHTEDP